MEDKTIGDQAGREGWLQLHVWGPFSMLASLPQPACHRSDKGRPLPAAILGLEEGHLALGRKLLHGFMHHLGEAAKRAERNRRSFDLLRSPSPRWAFFFAFIFLSWPCNRNASRPPFLTVSTNYFWVGFRDDFPNIWGNRHPARASLVVANPLQSRCRMRQRQAALCSTKPAEM